MATERRIERVRSVLERRQPDLRIVLEGVTLAHNASAVVRTCDASGVLYLDIVSPLPELVAFNEAITTRAERWIEVAVHPRTDECFRRLREAGLTIAATDLGPGTIPYTEFDYTRPCALVFGCEGEGISEEARALADVRLGIPMVGMVQSLNLSVSAAILLYEAFRQRSAKGMYDRRRLPDEEYERLTKKWLKTED